MVQTLQESPRILHLRKSLERNSRNVTLWEQLVQVYMQHQRYGEAAVAAIQLVKINARRYVDMLLRFERAAYHNPYNLSVRMALADLYQFYGEHEQAVMELEDILELDPNRLDAAQKLSRFYYKLGRGADVLKVLDNVSDLTRADVPMLVFMAKAYFREREWPKAAQLFERAYDAQAEVSHLKNLFEIYLQIQDLDALARASQRMIAQFPASLEWLRDQWEVVLKKFPAFGEGLRQLSQVYVNTVQPDKAVELVRQQLKLDNVVLDDRVAELRRILEHFPDFPAALYELALLEVRLKQYSPALERLQRLLQQDRPHYRDKVLRSLHAVLEAHPGQVLALRILGDLCLEEQRVDEAATAYRALIQHSPDDQPALLLRLEPLFKSGQPPAPLWMLGIELALHLGHHEQAEIWIARLKQMPEAKGYDHYWEAMLKRTHGQLVEALDLLAKANAILPADTQVHTRVRENLAQHWKNQLDVLGQDAGSGFARAQLYYDMGRVSDAAEAIQQAGSPDVSARFLLARCFKELGRYDLGLRQLRALADIDPKHTLFELGTLQELVGDLDGAIDTYKNLQQLDLNFPGLAKRIEAMGSTTMVHLRGKIAVPVKVALDVPLLLPVYVRNSEVEQWVKKHKYTLSPSLANPHNDRAVVHIFSGQWKAAEEELVLAQNLDPGLTAVQVNWTTLCLLRDDREGAEEHWQKAQHLNPRLPALWHLKGLMHLQKAEYKDAAQQFQHVLVQERRLSISSLNLGDVLYALGKVSAATDMWQQHLQTYLLSELSYRRLRAVSYARYHDSLITPFHPAAS